MKKNILIGFTVLLCALQFLLMPTKAQIQPEISFLISSGQLIPKFDWSTTEYEVTSLNTVNPILYTIKSSDPDVVATVNGKKVRINQGELLRLTQLSDNDSFAVDIDGAFGKRTFRFRTLPKDFPKFNVTAKDPVKGDIFMAPYTVGGAPPTYLIITNELGTVKYYNKLFGPAFDFQKITIDNKVYYTYLQGDLNLGQGTNNFPSRVVVMDSQFQKIRSFLPNNSEGKGKMAHDSHEFEMLGKNHYITTAYVKKNINTVPGFPQGSIIIDAVLQEYKDNKMIFQWKSSDYPELYAGSRRFTQFSDPKIPFVDYAHMNSVFVDTDGHFLVLMRFLDQVLKIHRVTGEIIWKFGGDADQFGLTKEMQFSLAHHFTRTASGTFLVFDNGNALGRSRIVEYDSNEKERKVNSFSTYEPNPNVFGDALGSVEKINNSYFIAWGRKRKNDPDITEYDLVTKTEQFRLKFVAPTTVTYRAAKYVP